MKAQTAINLPTVSAFVFLHSCHHQGNWKWQSTAVRKLEIQKTLVRLKANTIMAEQENEWTNVWMVSSGSALDGLDLRWAN